MLSRPDARPDALAAARSLVEERFPDALGAWLGGSAGTGRATATSDLDVVVLLADVAPYRLSVEHAGWPVELFVHIASSVRFYVGQDRERRRPTMARLVGEGRALVSGPEADALAAECREVLAAGPPPLTAGALEHRRYLLTDLLDDLAGGGPPAETAAVAAEVHRSAAELLVDLAGGWQGTGKWLAREVAVHDPERGERLADGLRSALAGDPGPLVAVVGEVLDRAGGPLWVGYRAAGETG